MCEKLSVKNFALAAGIVYGVCVALTTFAGIFGLFPMTNQILEDFYGKFFYSISWLGILLGLIYGFIDGIIFGAVFAWIYNKLQGN